MTPFPSDWHSAKHFLSRARSNRLRRDHVTGERAISHPGNYAGHLVSRTPDQRDVRLQQGNICIRPANEGASSPMLLHARYTLTHRTNVDTHLRPSRRPLSPGRWQPRAVLRHAWATLAALPSALRPAGPLPVALDSRLDRPCQPARSSEKLLSLRLSRIDLTLSKIIGNRLTADGYANSS